MLLVAVALLEAVSFVALYVAEGIRPGTVLDLFMDRHFAAITRESARKFGDGLYHPELGWDYEPLSHYEGINSAGDPYTMSWDAGGARDDGLFNYQPVMATYGDSFAAGEEVNNDETWQYFLSIITDKRVLNYGTSGYGTDQALMKFKLHLREHNIFPFTVITIYDDNIKRLLNMFRPFYRPGDGLTLGFKPRLLCSSSLFVESNPLVPYVEDASELRQLAESLVAADPYARAKVTLNFPYSLRLAQVFTELVRAKIGAGSWLTPGSLNLWADQDAVHLMQCIVGEFIELCRQYRSIPVILLIPRAGDENQPPYDQFVRQLKTRHPDVVVVDMAAQEFDVDRFRVLPKGGHTSAYGNLVIANALKEALGL